MQYLPPSAPSMAQMYVNIPYMEILSPILQMKIEILEIPGAMTGMIQVD